MANQGSYEYGSSILSDSNGMDNDYALLIINDSSISDGIFYSGWSKSNENPVISCGVHHPNGDPKKINFDNDIAYSSGSINWQGQGLHLQVHTGEFYGMMEEHTVVLQVLLYLMKMDY